MKEKKRSWYEKELDKVFSFLVRERDHWKCVRCYKPYHPPTSALHCSHYFSRRYRGTRWDFNNCDALCYGCHRMVEGDKQGWYSQFKKKQLGDREFSYLEARAYGITKYSIQDLEMLLKIFKEKQDELKGL